MGLESFYFGVKTAIFSSRGSAPHPAAGAGPWADPRVRPQRPQNLELGYRQKSPLPVRPRKKGRCKLRSLFFCVGPRLGVGLADSGRHERSRVPAPGGFSRVADFDICFSI